MEKHKSAENERRSGVDRRDYSYTRHVPERRTGDERRESQGRRREDQ